MIKPLESTSGLPSTFSLSKEDIRLIKFIRELEWGRIVLEVKGRKAVMIHKSVKDIKLTD